MQDVLLEQVQEQELPWAVALVQVQVQVVVVFLAPGLVVMQAADIATAHLLDCFVVEQVVAFVAEEYKDYLSSMYPRNVQLVDQCQIVQLLPYVPS